jgi:PhnB protein
MNQPYAPDGFNRAVPYLTVEGAHAVLDFVVRTFQAEVLDRVERPDGKLAYAAVQIGDSAIEMAEATSQFPAMPGAIHIYVPDVDQAHNRAIAKGGEPIHEPMDMDYGERASAIKDQAGNHWYIATYRRE